jgi:hypothetical protein
MSLHTVSDGYLALHARHGAEAAFSELARRYRPLILSATVWRTAGLEAEDARQEALLGLYEACLAHDPLRGRFEGLVRLRVRSRARNARIAALTGKQRLLTDALHDADEPVRRLAERASAPEGSDPAVVVVLRDELRERAQRAQRKAKAPRGDLRRRYTDEQIAHALSLIAQGKTTKEAAFAVGAPRDQVHRWIRRAGVPRPGGRRCFTDREIREAVQLVHDGATLRQAAAAVGATGPPCCVGSATPPPDHERRDHSPRAPRCLRGSSSARRGRTIRRLPRSCAPRGTARDRSGCAARSRPAITRAAGGCGPRTMSPTGCSGRRAGTAARRCAGRARSATARTPTS